MCSTGWGLQGHSCPITPWFISLLQLACMRRLFCCVGCYLQPERQAVCISGYTSVGCVWGNEMALLVMYLPSPFAEARLWIHLVISPFYQDAFTDKRNERVTADPSRWLFYIFSLQPLDNRGWWVVPLFLPIPFWQILLIFFFFPCCIFLCFSRHLLSFCSYTMSRSRWIFADPRNQTNEIKPVFFFSFLLFLLLPPLLPPVPISLSPVQYQMEMMRSLRHVNIDHLHVGWYQSTYYGSFVSRALLDSQFSYQHAIEESVVLIYGKYSDLFPFIPLVQRYLPDGASLHWSI